MHLKGATSRPRLARRPGSASSRLAPASEGTWRTGGRLVDIRSREAGANAAAALMAHQSSPSAYTARIIPLRMPSRATVSRSFSRATAPPAPGRRASMLSFVGRVGFSFGLVDRARLMLGRGVDRVKP
jgi:hypothetical protein